MDGIDHIGRYEVLGELGRGGQGTVYQAHDPLLGREVAIKVLDYQADHDSDYLQALQREARLAAGLDHPYVTTVHDFSEEGDTPYIVMEYLPDSLDRHISGGGRLDWGRAVRIALQVAQALAYAHSQGIVHRDIKPHNILLRENGDVSVADFGLARASAISGRSRSTGYGGMLGTPEYMAPEQWSEGPVDGRVDQYALGVLLYQMISGYLPFEGDIPVLYSQHKEKPFPRLSASFGVSLQGRHIQVDAIVQRATSKDPDTRYSTMEDMVVDLESVLKGIEISEASSKLVSRPSLLDYWTSVLRRRLWIVFGGMIGVTVLAVLVAVYATVDENADNRMPVSTVIPADVAESATSTVPGTTNPANTIVPSEATKELVSYISAWHTRWDRPGVTAVQHQELVDELIEYTPDSYSQEDPLLSLAVETYISAHQLHSWVRENHVYRLIESQTNLGLDPEIMDGPCDLPHDEDVSEELFLELMALKMECFVLETTEGNLDVVRVFSEESWLNSGQIRPLSPVPDTLVSALSWIGDWHVRWEESGMSVDEMNELSQELDVFMKSNAEELARMESPMIHLLMLYDNLHFVVAAMRNNTITRGVNLTLNGDIEISNLPSPCEIPDMVDIPQHLEESVSNLASECFAAELAEYLLTVQRKFTEETWLQGYIQD